MPFDGSGGFTRVMNWQSDAAAGIRVKADRHDAEDNNLAQGLSNCITKDGQTQPTANIPMNAKKLTNLGAPTVSGDAATKGYVDALKTFSEALSITGTDAKGRITFTGSQSPDTDANSRPLGIAWTQADLYFGVRPNANPGAGDLPRFIWNDKADGLGNDLMKLTDTGVLTLERSASGVALTLISTSNATGSASGPDIRTYRRNIDGSVANNGLAQWQNYGRNDADEDVAYTSIASYIAKSTTNAEEGSLSLRVAVAGALATRLAVTVDGITVYGGTTTSGALRLTTTSDVSLTSTGHGLQIGPDTGTNIRMDNNEIMAVNNGVASSLFLNGEGGEVSCGGDLVLGSGRVTAAFTSSFGPTDGTASSAAGGVVVSSSGTVTSKRPGTSSQGGFYCYNNAAVTPTMVAVLGSSTIHTMLSNESGGNIYLRPSGINSATGQAILNQAGDLSLTGKMLSDSYFTSIDTACILAATGSGTIYLRPNGDSNTTNSTTIETDGTMTVRGPGNFDGSLTAYNGGNMVAGHSSASSSGTVPCTVVAGTGGVNIRRAGPGRNVDFLNAVGPGTGTRVGDIVTTSSGTSYNVVSDENLKDFIGPYDPLTAIAIIRADPVRDFNWNENSGAPGEYSVGWGAQTSYAIRPDLASPPPPWEFDPLTPEITEEPQPGQPGYSPWGLDQGKRTPYLWAALSWALDRIDELMADMAALKGAPA